MQSFRLALAVCAAAAAIPAQAQKAERGHYIVQLADAPLAVYSGTVAGYAATRPAVGAKVSTTSAAAVSYAQYLDNRRAAVLSRLSPRAQLVYSYNVAFNGFSAMLTAADVAALKADPAVVAVNLDVPRPVDTTRTPAFLGLSTSGGVWSQADAQGRPIRGENVIVGIVDTGVWPENPAFSDKVDAGGNPVASYLPGTVAYVPPAGWAGSCVAGPGFSTSSCNNKLIGARYYKAGFDAGGLQLVPLEYASPRDGDGHGSHTASTAAGNQNVAAQINGAPIGNISGMAPRARVATYKVCWNYVGGTQATCFASDSVAAIDTAVADGVNVINFSIGGTQTDYLDSVEVAFLNAAAAGVFVAASAGNDGPANTVEHISPWLTAVAASTHDRSQRATATLGNGSVYTGASLAPRQVSGPLILGNAAAATAPFDDTNTNARLCFLNALDPAKVAGKIVVCDRGTNARVEKSQEVARAGGVGMVLVNASTAANDIVEDAHYVPSVHLAFADRAAVRAYAALAGATATISAAFNQPGVIAPVMASFSSRGPSLADPNILKPDITAPGVSIYAAYNAALTQAEHDALVAGTFVPPAPAGILSGTSMSSPHIAGIAALLKQQHPTWSPAAIKSALMTSTTGVKLASGADDTARFGYGSGHVNPPGAVNIGLVYDAGYGDYAAYLCGIAALPPSNALCQTYGAVLPWNLNLPSLTGEVVGKLTLRRTVTNRGAAAGTFTASSNLAGYDVTVTPSVLTLTPGQSASFDVNVVRNGAALGSWVFGDLTWTSGGTQTKSPLTVRAVTLGAVPEVTDTRSSGTKLLSVRTAFDGRLGIAARGLLPATRTPGTVVTNQTQCTNIVVPAGTLHARFALYNSDTGGGAASDLDLEIRLNGTVVGSSGSGTSDERVDLPSPAAGTYAACVIGYAPAGGSAGYVLSSWVLQPAAAGNLNAGAGSRSAAGGTTSVALSWSVAGGVRYLGAVDYSDPASAGIGRTLLTIDSAPVVAPSQISGGRKSLATLAPTRSSMR